MQPWVSIDNTSRLLLGAVAFVLWFVWFHTDFTEKVPRAERKAAAASRRSERPSSEQTSAAARGGWSAAASTR